MPSDDQSSELERRMAALGIRENDLVEKFILGSGKGGQKINKTSSCVYLKHLPTGIEVKCQASRSRETNRQTAREELCHELENRARQRDLTRRQAIEKRRRRNRQRSRRSKARSVADKRQHSRKKQLRRRPSRDD